MWYSSKRFDDLLLRLFDLTSANAALTADKIELTRSNARLSAINDWMRVQINTLTVERASLMEKLTGVRPPTPEILSTEAPARQQGIPNTDIFADPEEDSRDPNAARQILESHGFRLPAA